MAKIPDNIPSETIKITLFGEHLDTLKEIVAESRRIKPDWKDTEVSVLTSVVMDFLDDHEPFDKFVLTRLESQERDLLRMLDQLKELKKAAKSGDLGATAALEKFANGDEPEPVPSSSPTSTSPKTPLSPKAQLPDKTG